MAVLGTGKEGESTKGDVKNGEAGYFPSCFHQIITRWAP